ncbi:MAG: redox-sensing transcriptional repressor Rex [Planctomycetota bacterium]|nr:MAG: redox-sensing transcriptional repressor Rex [Planctomycetota bacterium]REJ97846.1 MAG: redox-sensing transcriptional repressor Rex [Planctomycetota bacterium]
MPPSERKKPAAENDAAVPKAVVNRLSLYLRELQHLVAAGSATTSSGQLGQKLGFTDAQVRKDLAYFGQFGYPGVGYRCDELIEAIRGILGTNRHWPMAIVGIGNLGRALLGYKGFSHQGFRIVAGFDADASKIGTSIEGVEIFDIAELTNVVQQRQIKLGVIAVPAAAAQQVADQLVAAKVLGIVNFAPVTITLPEHVSHVGVDLAIEMEQIAFAVVNRLSGG